MNNSDDLNDNIPPSVPLPGEDVAPANPDEIEQSGFSQEELMQIIDDGDDFSNPDDTQDALTNNPPIAPKTVVPAKKPPSKYLKIIQGIVVTAIAGIGFMYLNSTNSPETTPAIPTVITTVATSTENQPTVSKVSMKTEKIKSYSVEDAVFTRTRTLEQINKSQNIIQTIAQMKKDLESLRMNIKSRSQSKSSLEAAQKTLISALISLHKLTSIKELTLTNGDILTSSSAGYSLKSGLGIITPVNNGTYISMSSGYMLKNTSNSELIFVFTSLKKNQYLITDIYKTSPLHGLMSIRDTTEGKKAVAISQKNADLPQGMTLSKFDNTVLFFNNKGTLSATKKFSRSITQDQLEKQLIKSKTRNVVGFETSEFDLYETQDNSIYIDESPSSINGYSQDISMRLAVYSDNSTAITVEKTIMEILSGNTVIKRLEMSEIGSIFFKKTIIKEIQYYSKDGIIYSIDQSSKKIPFGPGRIIANVINQMLSDEQIILNTKEVKISGLEELIGMTLLAESGNQYKVSNLNTIKLPENQVILTSELLISSTGSLMSKSRTHLDQIVSFSTTKKSGARITTLNYIISIPSKSRANVFTKETLINNLYKDPKILFIDKEWIHLKAKSPHTWDENNKTINSTSYTKVEDLSNNKYRFVLPTGEYYNEPNRDIDFSESEILKERISDIETIEGDAFDYIYIIDKKTGKLSSSEIGELVLKHKKEQFATFTSAIKQKNLAHKKAEVKRKNVYTLSELAQRHAYIKHLVFKTMSGDELIITSANSIMINGTKVMLTMGKLNMKLGIFILDIDPSISPQTRRVLNIPINKNKLERTIAKALVNAPSYYNDDVMIVSKNNKEKSIKLIKNNKWTQIYSEEVNLATNSITLLLKPYDDLTNQGILKLEIDLESIDIMSKPMEKDLISQHSQFLTSELIPKGPSKSETDNLLTTKELKSTLASLQRTIAGLTGSNLQMVTNIMTPRDLQQAEKKQKNKNSFMFDVGTELTYKINRAIEISEGSSGFFHTTLDQKYFEDREGNSLDMNDPVIIIEATGDFNTNSIIFTPKSIIYTDSQSTRKTITIPDGSTVLEYSEQDTDYVLSGVPAFYINQKVRELPTTVMLSTLKGVVDSMTAPEDGIEGALAGLTGDAGADTGGAFTEGVASGASDGIGEILEIYKSKAASKQDILIATGGISLKSIFIKTTAANEGSGGD